MICGAEYQYIISFYFISKGNFRDLHKNFNWLDIYQ